MRFSNEGKTKRKNEAKNDVSFVYVSSLVHTEDKSAFVKAENWVMVVLVLAIVGAVGFGYWYFFKKGKGEIN